MNRATIPTDNETTEELRRIIIERAPRLTVEELHILLAKMKSLEDEGDNK